MSTVAELALTRKPYRSGALLILFPRRVAWGGLSVKLPGMCGDGARGHGGVCCWWETDWSEKDSSEMDCCSILSSRSSMGVRGSESESGSGTCSGELTVGSTVEPSSG